ncbi:hypothetical protein NT2_05_02870 [Caenibius tardaugens NBRC 16725]|uniref:Uncharacterized protein n=1 Tax=Caenibius tardaugens NBRC 16725 TaxID=1219035 RepID=U2YLT9_9SPHN|nr:hypothetical protein [Caenibius tardaugens]AZI36705.1 hypothetical protein EGO55_12680 [Caenibius tardaugens NBRC 16725]GAD49367.1 hypothetical protein NT2_05_02870 [Caenibius tardaugens NBRC 16725]
MSEPKPLASLNSSLLARKGGARPAMRSQHIQPYMPLGVDDADDPNRLEDLGWNDMGDHAVQAHTETLQLTPAPINPETAAEARAEDELAAAQLAQHAHRGAVGMIGDDPSALESAREEAPAKPQVVLQQEEIAVRMDASYEADPEHEELPSWAEETDKNETASEAVLQIKQPRRGKARSRRSALNDGRRAAFTLRLDAERHLKLRLACTVRNSSAQQIVTEALDEFIDSMAEINLLAAQVKRQH